MKKERLRTVAQHPSGAHRGIPERRGRQRSGNNLREKLVDTTRAGKENMISRVLFIRRQGSKRNCREDES